MYIYMCMYIYIYVYKCMLLVSFRTSADRERHAASEVSRAVGLRSWLELRGCFKDPFASRGPKGASFQVALRFLLG